MRGMYDATCPRCRKRFGWAGEMKDRPPCPRCGHQIDPAALAKAEQEMEAHRQRLLEEDED